MSTESKAKTEYMWRRKGISRASIVLYEAILVLQGGNCKLCIRKQGRKRFALDFDKETGQIRGLLCPICNLAVREVEHLLANKARLDQIVDYIAAKGVPDVLTAEANIANLNPVVINPAIYLRRDRAIRRFQELQAAQVDPMEAYRIIAAEVGKSARTVMRYLGRR